MAQSTKEASLSKTEKRTVTADRVTFKMMGFVWVITILTLALSVQSSYSANNQSYSVDGIIPPEWSHTLPSRTCPGVSHTNCHYSSPVLYDLNGDGFLEIVVATNNGFVVAMRHDGTEMWRRDVAPYYGMAAGTQIMTSSPAVADIDGNGFPEIVIATGTVEPGYCAHGGILVLDRYGNRKGLQWPRLTFDLSADGCREGIFSTPALGDLNKDGQLEIVVGGFDKRIYAWRADGSLMPGFPADSHLLKRFPTWPNLVGSLGDTVWSSPALADVNGDGYLEIIIGTDEGNLDDRWGGDSGGWTCPYTLPPGWAPGSCGGSLYVLDRFGQVLPGFPIYVLEIIQSTPVVADVTGDGNSEIFVGTGTFYHDNSPDHPISGFRLYAWTGNGQPLPGWEGGKVVGGLTPASPVIGDITGDGQPEIVVAATDKKLYAWRPNGQLVSGFPMTPRDHFGSTLSFYTVPTTFILGDYTGDGRMEIFFNLAWGVAIVNGIGQQLTSTNWPSDPRPVYVTDGSLLNNPVLGDLNGNGRLELVVSNSRMFAWELPNSSPAADWPMYKRDAARTSALPTPARLELNPPQLLIMYDPGQDSTAQGTLLVRNTGGQPLNWSMSPPAGVSLAPASGSLPPGSYQSVAVSVNASSYANGAYSLGAIATNGANSGGGPAQNSPAATAVSLYVGPVTRVFLPIAQR
jgi:hypothetical protein